MNRLNQLVPLIWPSAEAEQIIRLVMISTYQRQTEHRLKCLSDKYIADEHSGNTATRAFYIFIDYLREERQLTKRDFD